MNNATHISEGLPIQANPCTPNEYRGSKKGIRPASSKTSHKTDDELKKISEHREKEKKTFTQHVSEFCNIPAAAETYDTAGATITETTPALISIDEDAYSLLGLDMPETVIPETGTLETGMLETGVLASLTATFPALTLSELPELPGRETMGSMSMPGSSSQASTADVNATGVPVPGGSMQSPQPEAAANAGTERQPALQTGSQTLVTMAASGSTPPPDLPFLTDPNGSGSSMTPDRIFVTTVPEPPTPAPADLSVRAPAPLPAETVNSTGNGLSVIGMTDAPAGDGSAAQGQNAFNASAEDQPRQQQNASSGKEWNPQIVLQGSHAPGEISTPSAPADATPLSTPAQTAQSLTPSELIERFDRLVMRAIGSDDRSIRVELQPAELGRMVVSCRESAEGLRVEISVQDQDIRTLMIGQEQSLRHSLEGQGMQLGQFSVTCQDRQDKPSGNPFTPPTDEEDTIFVQHKGNVKPGADVQNLYTSTRIGNRWVA